MREKDILQAQILEELKQTKYALSMIEVELDAKSEHLAEVNTALKVLLKQRDDDKTKLQENVLENVRQLVRPSLEELKKSKLNARQTAILSTLELSLNEIISPFVVNLSSGYSNLTPTEIRVANMIKDGSGTKDIAALFCLSEHTIKSHRSSIRRKLKLKNKHINLESHLRSLQG